MLTKEQESDVVMMKRPDLGQGWPMWPYLPVERQLAGQQKQCGFLVDESFGEKIATVKPIIYLASVYALGKEIKRLSDIKEKKEYTTVEEMVADGWKVD